MRAKSLKQLTKLINAYLRLDEGSTARLRKLQNKTLALQIQPMGWTFQCSFSDKGIHIDQAEMQSADASIEGTPLQLLAVMMNKSERQTAFLDELTITGDAQVAQDVIELFDALEIDWEELFSGFIGDVPAYYTNRTLQTVRNWFGEVGDSFMQNVDEYIHEEVTWLPTRKNLDEFYQQIDTLRMDVDRIEARIQRLNDLDKHEENH